MVWDLAKPSGSLPLDEGDNRCREHFDHLDDALSREHEFPGRYGLDSGRHALPVASSAADIAAITNPVDGMLAGRDDIAAIMQRQAGSFVGLCGVTYGTSIQRGYLPLIVGIGDIPVGYRWVDSDAVGTPAHPLWVWTGSEWVRAMREEGIEIGGIKVVTYSSTPTGWLECNGAERNPVGTYADLYAVIGKTFNTGGESPGYFRVPQTRGKSIFGLFPYSLWNPATWPFQAIGLAGGVKTHDHDGSHTSEKPDLPPVQTNYGSEDPPHPDKDHTHDIVIPSDDHLSPFLTLRFLIKY